MKSPKPDWAEYVIMFIFLATATVILGYLGALLLELIFNIV